MLKNLGRHIDGRAYASTGHSAPFPEEFSEAEVAYLEDFPVDQHVGSLEIAVDDSELTELLEALGDLADDDEGGVLGGPAGGAVALEISPRAVLHDEVDIVLRVDDLHARGDTS